MTPTALNSGDCICVGYYKPLACLGLSRPRLECMSISLSPRGLVRSGLPLCMNLSRSVFISPSSELRPGIGGGSLFWYHSLGRCRVCTKQVTHQDGIFCANFGHQVGNFPKCHSAWCPDCYREIPGEDFLVYRAKDADGHDMLPPGEEEDYRGARPGDHLVFSFDCDACAFFRLKGRLPVKGKLLRRSDPLSHSSGEFGCLLVSQERDHSPAAWHLPRAGRYWGKHGITMTPPRGPFPARHDFGMRMAIGVLEKSVTAGRHEATTKFSNVRKITSLHEHVQGVGFGSRF
jgi:hypothetical protein